MKQENKEAQYREEFCVWQKENGAHEFSEDCSGCDFLLTGYLAGRKKGEEELILATRKIMNAEECTCEPMPSINECPFHLHKEISKQDDQIESLKKELVLTDNALSEMLRINIKRRNGLTDLAKEIIELKKETYRLSQDLKTREQDILDVLAEKESLEKEIEELSLNYNKIHSFCLDYQMYIHSLLASHGIFQAFQQMRKNAYSQRVDRGETPIWGDSSYTNEGIERLDNYEDKIQKLRSLVERAKVIMTATIPEWRDCRDKWLKEMEAMK